MPQLDKFSFFSQIFWLFLLFIIFYFFLIIIVLPNLSSLLKIRYKKLLKLKQNLLNYMKIELNLNQIKLNNIINILLITNNSVFHYNFLLDKYNLSINTKIKNYLILQDKINIRLIHEIFERLFKK
jgi:hypothetical protein